jgi:hypothetical protein
MQIRVQRSSLQQIFFSLFNENIPELTATECTKYAHHKNLSGIIAEGDIQCFTGKLLQFHVEERVANRRVMFPRTLVI